VSLAITVFLWDLLKKIERMDEHNEYVREVTPPEKFSMMELSEGWGLLCKILGTFPTSLFQERTMQRL
jgi:hypothetical protein